MLGVITIIMLAFLPALILPTEELNQDTSAAGFVRTLRLQYYQQHPVDHDNTSSAPGVQAPPPPPPPLFYPPRPPTKAIPAAVSDCGDNDSPFSADGAQ